MLQKLHIENYAIIDKIEIDFDHQLNIITGETGAGKSILVGALSLILGERAESAMLMNDGKKCYIEGVFLMPANEGINSFLKENELDSSEEIILRREVAPNGKSRAFINDTPATLQQLKQLASLLVDLHQQFDTLELNEADFQREVIDALAKNEVRLKEYRQAFSSLQKIKQELDKLHTEKNNFNKELGYNQFQLDELNELSFKENELEELEGELKTLSNAENIKLSLNKVQFELNENEQPVVQTIKQLINELQQYASYQKSIPSIIERLQSANIELQDIAAEVEDMNNKINYDEKRIDFINERLSAGYKLLKKHGVQTTNDLLAIQSELDKKIQGVLNIDDIILSKEKELSALLQHAESIATTLSAARKKQAIPFEQKVNELLAKVGMPNARLKVDIKETALSSIGKDAIAFLFDANKSNRYQPLQKVASGGELSRLMLSIKSLVADSIDLPTMIFDEIDTGISGEAAKQVGIIMKQLSEKRQVISITHQPQIAGRANAHFFVYKEIKDNAVKTNIRLLSQEERITNIAQMLSGEKPTAAALQNAREMVNN